MPNLTAQRHRTATMKLRLDLIDISSEVYGMSLEAKRLGSSLNSKNFLKVEEAIKQALADHRNNS